MDKLFLTIYGEPASKANSRRLVKSRKTGAVLFIKSAKAMSYAQTALLQIPTLPLLVTGKLRVSLWIYYASERPDLDESLILDLLQGRVYENDRQVRERHVYHRIDRQQPRALIEIEELEADGHNARV